MKLKISTTPYGHEVINCPFCDYFSYVKRTAYDPTNGIKRHITNAARAEALDVILEKKSKTPHLDYYKEHTAEKRITPNKRHFDDDLKI